MSVPTTRIWIEGDDMYTHCKECGASVPLDVQLTGSYDGVTYCPTCGSMYFVYVESRGWDIEVFDKDGNEYTKGEYQV